LVTAQSTEFTLTRLRRFDRPFNDFHKASD
jgi:hypothetical protein